MRTRKEFNERDYVGKEFSFLTILRFTKITQYPNRPDSIGQRYCLCECRCGGIKEFSLNNVKHGLSKSCGCKPYENANPYLNTKIYRTYSGMKDRCHYKNTESYKNYGGRGITVCDRWKESFHNFLEDMGQPPTDEHSIDRIDNDGNYELDNCRWATQKQQMNNTRLTGKLTARNLAKLTGYSGERVRQLTNPTSSSPYDKTFPLEKFIIGKIGRSNIYSQDAVEFLVKRYA